jgi:3-isopropylmalate/(R)-2-methylmalate dehydratase large subunit
VRCPIRALASKDDQAGIEEALQFMGFDAGQRIAGTRIDVAFIGSCTNSRLSDLREAARVVRGHRVAPSVKALVVPGSEGVGQRPNAKACTRSSSGGFEWRGAGCSMCLAMNPIARRPSGLRRSSNSNFKGRQGSPTGRTLLMSPAMVGRGAIAGEVVDVRTRLATWR